MRLCENADAIQTPSIWKIGGVSKVLVIYILINPNLLKNIDLKLVPTSIKV